MINMQQRGKCQLSVFLFFLSSTHTNFMSHYVLIIFKSGCVLAYWLTHADADHPIWNPAGLNIANDWNSIVVIVQSISFLFLSTLTPTHIHTSEF